MSRSDIRSLLEPASDLTPPSPSRAASRRVLEGCWPLLRDAIEPVMVDVLLQAMGSALRSGQMDEVDPARKLMARDRVFTEAFSAALQSEFKTALDDFVAHKTTHPDAVPGLKHWSLVEYGEMELSTAIETGSNRMRNAVEEAYTEVLQRLANLVREPDLRDSDNPLRPALLLRAVHAALRAAEVKDDNVLHMFLQRFESALTLALTHAYVAINTYFEAQGVSGDPDIAAIALNTVGNGARGARASRFISGASPESMLRALYERLGEHPVTVPHSTPTRPPSMPVSPAGAIDPHLMAAIDQLQKLGAMALAALKQDAPGSVHPAQEDGEAEQLRASLVQKAPRQLDKLTIEIVGLLFDRVNRDAYVPQEVKALIQQLQYPLIKVALVDPELFASSEHPARRLIDRIASTSVGWVGQGQENARYLNAVNKAIGDVLAADDEMVSAFVNALESFEAYLESEHTRDDDPVARARRALVEAENREIMVINATIKIRRAFDAVQLESYLRDFLLQVWPRVLVAAALREKSSEAMHAAAKNYLSIVPDLVWSVQPKLNTEERKRLVNTIPAVLAGLRQGLTLIEWPKERIQKFFAHLMNSHAQAVKALELAQAVATPVFETSTLRIKLDGIEQLSSEWMSTEADQVHVADDIVRQALTDNDADVVHIAAPTVPGTPNDGVDDGQRAKAAAWAHAMKCGQWFLLERNGVSQRVQLRWASPHRTLFLLTTAQDGVAQSLSADALLEMIRTQQIRPIEESSLFDRAVKGVLHELRDASTASAYASSETAS